MNFSYEEIYSMYGQFDALVQLELVYKSPAYNKYGRTLLGVFKYTLEQRQELERIIKFKEVPRSNQFIQFEPSEYNDLSAAQIESLNREGIENQDISTVSSLSVKRQNRYNIKEKKEIQNTVVLEYDGSGIDENRLKLKFLNLRKGKNYLLAPEEKDAWLGLSLVYEPEIITGDIEILNERTGKVKEGIRYHQLNAKFSLEAISEEEEEEFNALLFNRAKAKMEILIRELKRSTEKIKNIRKENPEIINYLTRLCVSFEDEVLLPYEIPIWVDFERFLHIYIRHVEEVQVGERFSDKTVFQYHFKDILRLIKLVIASVYEEIKAHFSAKPTQNFRRMGRRSVYYDGNYYRVEIEPSGKLITFHPYNDNRKEELN